MTKLPPGLHGAHQYEHLQREFGARRVRALLAEGRLVRFSRSVLIDRTQQLAVRARAAATLLLAGERAVLTSHTAAFLFGCTAADEGRVHILVDYHRKMDAVPGVAIHQGIFYEHDVVLLDGLRMHTLECAITELLCRESRRVALACADQAFALTPSEQREEFRAELEHRIATRRDSRGRRRAGILLDLATGEAESPAESWLLLDLYDAGFSIPKQQVPVTDLDGRVRYRLDLAWEEPRIAVEYDGYEAHVDRAERDVARDEDLRRRGWLVIRATSVDLRDSTRLHAAIRQAFWQRRFAA